MSNSNNVDGTFGLVLLTAVFVVLKALGYIDWRWVWVFSPLWIPAAGIFVIFLIILAIAMRD